MPLESSRIERAGRLRLCPTRRSSRRGGWLNSSRPRARASTPGRLPRLRRGRDSMEASPTAKETRSTRGSGRSNMSPTTRKRRRRTTTPTSSSPIRSPSSLRPPNPRHPLRSPGSASSSSGTRSARASPRSRCSTFSSTGSSTLRVSKCETCSSSRWTSTRCDGATRTAWRGWTPRMP